MRYLLTAFAIIATTIAFSQLYDESGQYSIDEAQKSWKYSSVEQELTTIQGNISTQGSVIISLAPKEIKIEEDGEIMKFTVESIVARMTAKRYYTMYVCLDEQGDEVTVCVKWNMFSEQYYFEVEGGTTPYNGYRLTLIETTKK